MGFDDITAWIVHERSRLNTLFVEIVARPVQRGGILEIDVRCWLVDMRFYLARIHDVLSAQ
jgi:hypothetical protein